MTWARKVTPLLYKPRSMTVTIEYNDDGELHFHGVGPDGSGQCDFTLVRGDGRLTEGFTREMCRELYEAWNRWHLNTLRAGTPKQEAAIRLWNENNEYSYEAACEFLDSIGLLVDNGYKYGTSWLKEEVPTDVLEWLFTLPGEGATFQDIYTPKIEEEDFLALLNGGADGTS